MAAQIELTAGAMMLAEIQEYATFDRETQRYISRSLGIAFDPDFSPVGWARNAREAEDIGAQMRAYRLLRGVRASIPTEDSFVDAELFLLPLISTTAFDLGCSPITTFAQYRFLYERLLGAAVRPWLPTSFLAVAALPNFPAELRSAFLASLQFGLTDQWSVLEPTFFPQWLDSREGVAA